MKIVKFIITETKQVIPAVIFFAITFNLIVLTEKLMIRHEQPSFLSYGLATLSALIVGKCLIIVNSFPFINAFPKKPLIYNIVWKFFLYGSFILLFRIIDKMTHFYFEHNNPEMIYQKITITLAAPTFWAIQIWLLMLFVAYIVASEFIRVMGKREIMKLLLGSKEKNII